MILTFKLRDRITKALGLRQKDIFERNFLLGEGFDTLHGYQTVYNKAFVYPSPLPTTDWYVQLLVIFELAPTVLSPPPPAVGRRKAMYERQGLWEHLQDATDLIKINSFH